MKQNKCLKVLLISVVFSLGACSSTTTSTSSQVLNSSNSSTQKMYTVTWKVDGETYEEKYLEGETPVYKFGTEKEADETYTYTFSGWDKLIEPVSADVTYEAQYVKEYIDYTYTWVVDDEEYEETYHYGDTASYKEETPTKEGNEQYSYTFSGWDKEVGTVTGDERLVAQFDKEVNQYEITFDVNGVKTTETYYYGELPIYEGSLTKESDETYTYTFSGWNNAITPVTGDETYVAQFDTKLIQDYNINFYDFDGNLLDTQALKEGSIPNFSGELPTIKDDNNTYEFAGWLNRDTNEAYENDLPAVTGDTNYYAYAKELGILTINLFDKTGELKSSTSQKILNNEAYTYTTPVEENLVASHDKISGVMNLYATHNIYYSEIDVWNGSVSASFEEAGTEADPYLISSAADFALLQANVAAGTTYKGSYFKMTKSVDFNGANFMVGSFGGTFDGNNCSVRGLAINNTTADTGLFTSTTAGEIKNLSTYGSVVGTSNVGGIVGTSNGLVSNCTNFAVVKGNGNRGGIAGVANGKLSNCVNYGDSLKAGTSGWTVGGLAGNTTGGVDNCINFGKVEGATTHVGGLLGGATADVTNCINYGDVEGMTIGGAGLVANVTDGVKISNCINRGNIISNVTTDVWTGSVGGIAGKSNGASISNCINYGNLNYTVTNQSKTTGIGGIAGANLAAITNCKNYGDINTNQRDVGGIAGDLNSVGSISYSDNYGDITNCTNTSGGIAGLVSGNIYNCKNYGNISATSWNIGGVAGRNAEGSIITNCENNGTVVSTSGTIGGISGTNQGTISSCTNNGSVTCLNQAGGIAGNNQKTITDCTNNGIITVTNGTEVDGIIGKNTGTMTNCTNTGEIVKS